MKAFALVAPPHDPSLAGTVFGHMLGEDWSVTGYASAADVPADIADEAEIIIATAGPAVGDDLLERCPKLRLIQVPGHGFDHVDVEAARRRGVPVATVHSSGAEAHTVAEMALLLAGVTSRRIITGHNRIRAGAWPNTELMQAGLFELANKTIGIVGFGKIGRELARRALAFDMTVIYTDALRPDPKIEQALGVSFREFDDLLRESDFVSVHVPSMPSTRGLIGAREFGLMKHEAILINTARGPVVDRHALLEALQTKRIRGAALDVFDPEPPAPDDPLLHLDNVVLSPHMAGVTAESLIRILQAAMANCNRVARGEEPLDVL